VFCWWVVYLLLDLNQRHLGLWYQSLKILNYESTTITFTLSEVSADFDATDIAKELYFSFLVDRSHERIVMVGSAQGVASSPKAKAISRA
jgi:hypothetical protein